MKDAMFFEHTGLGFDIKTLSSIKSWMVYHCDREEKRYFSKKERKREMNSESRYCPSDYDTEWVRTIECKESEFSKGLGFDSVDQLLNETYIFIDGEYWELNFFNLIESKEDICRLTLYLRKTEKKPDLDSFSGKYLSEYENYKLISEIHKEKLDIWRSAFQDDCEEIAPIIDSFFASKWSDNDNKAP